MEIQLTDVTLHVDENLESGRRQELDTALRAVNGVVSVHNPDAKPHLIMVEYNPDSTTSRALLDCVLEKGVHAELIGL
ncbi:MAG: ATP-binding protein [Pseudomonadota bacterium]|nr:ATP-binding protein [Pseudomonadota bacterium]